MRSVVVGAKIALLIVAVGGIVALTRAIPVTNEALRIADPAGEWRTVWGDRMYTPAIYFREKAFQHMAAAATSGDATIERVGLARELALDALDAAPADPFAWTILAWCEMLLGNDAEATFALQRSWEVAPHLAALAEDRLLIADALGLPASADDDILLRDSLAADIQSLTSVDVGRVDRLTERSADLRAIAQQAAPAS